VLEVSYTSEKEKVTLRANGARSFYRVEFRGWNPVV